MNAGRFGVQTALAILTLWLAISCLNANAITFFFNPTFVRPSPGWQGLPYWVEVSQSAYDNGGGTASDILDFEFHTHGGLLIQRSDPSLTLSGGAFSVSSDKSYLLFSEEFHAVITAYSLARMRMEPFWFSTGPCPEFLMGYDGPPPAFFCLSSYGGQGDRYGEAAGAWVVVPEPGVAALFIIGLIALRFRTSGSVKGR